MDIAIINTWLLTFQGTGLGIIREGALGIEDGRISYAGKSDDFNHDQAEMVIDGSDHVTMPGLINAHAHTGLTLLRGAAQDLPEIEWMNKGIGPFTNHLTAEDVIVGSKLGVLEGLKSGTTTFTEYARDVSTIVKNVYLPFQARVVAIETINEVISDRTRLKPGDLYEFDQSKGEAAIKRANDLNREFENNELVSTMYGPQALDMVSNDTLINLEQMTVDRNCRMHMHVAQGKRERLQITGRYGKNSSTISVLEKYGLLGNHLLAAHCHDTTEAERALMVKKGVKMVGCPSSISLIDGIIPPLWHYMQLGGETGLGTDQVPGPGHINMFREMRVASMLSKVVSKDPTALPPWKSLQLATIDGARVLGLEQETGSLIEGKRADVITVNLNHTWLNPIVERPFSNIIPNLVYSSTGSEVDNVIINGKLVITGGNFTSIDEQQVIRDARKRSARIFESADEDWIRAGSKMVMYRREGWL
ncbi:MAG: amidohydrolase family protein [Candidatus Odinarchaeota archaeon]